MSDAMSRTRYDASQICLNGHVITESLMDYPEYNVDFCAQCGAPTIIRCPNCQQNINMRLSQCYISTKPPAFCVHCGQPFPWTASRLEAARQMTEELEGLDAAEKELLNSSIKDLVSDTPMTTVSASRFKRLVAKAGPAVGGVFRDILVSVVTEAAKKQIWG